jgi:hypothetical protein
MKRFSLILLSIFPFALHAQDHQHHMHESSDEMTHSFSRSLPMNRNGSGTSWLPDETPMYAYMVQKNKWSYMLHGSLFLRYNMQNFNNDSLRGGNKFDAPNWVMGMAQRKIGEKGLLNFKAMLSADLLTVGGNGYPLLFQSGETWKGQPLVDRQHPHDLFTELSVGYTHKFNNDIDAFIYLGYPGEPALGPTAFMHRISSMNNPDAPLGHHWQDATHITFGVATLGFRYKFLKLEGSSFTGREPNEKRYDFDQPRFDSYSYRLSIQPSKNISLQGSQAFIKEPELLHSGENVTRTTASVDYAKNIDHNDHFTAAIVWGMNDKGDHNEHSFLTEANFQFNKNAIYGRYEWAQKSAEELVIIDFEEEELFAVNAITIGYNRRFVQYGNTDFTIGIQGSWFIPDKDLTIYYGDDPLSAEVYVKVSPSLMRHNQ